jgi:hypothetical protein
MSNPDGIICHFNHLFERNALSNACGDWAWRQGQDDEEDQGTESGQHQKGACRGLPQVLLDLHQEQECASYWHFCVKPMVTEKFGGRMQVDVIDYQSSQDMGFRLILNLQDYHTKF